MYHKYSIHGAYIKHYFPPKKTHGPTAPSPKKRNSLGFPFGNKIEAENLWIKNLQDEPQIFIDTLRMDSWEFLDDELGQPNIWGFCLFPYKTDRTKRKQPRLKMNTKTFINMFRMKFHP